MPVILSVLAKDPVPNVRCQILREYAQDDSFLWLLIQHSMFDVECSMFILSL